MTAEQKIIDRFRSAVEDERMRSTFVEDLAALNVDEVRERITELETYADAIEAAQDAVGGWVDADDREGKASAKEDALQQLDELVDAFDAMDDEPEEPKAPTPSIAPDQHAVNLAWIARASLAELDAVGDPGDDRLLPAIVARREELS